MTKTYIAHPKLNDIARNLSKKSGITTALIGCVVLLGWILNIPVFKSVLPELVTMKVNTALGFLFGGTSLCLWHQYLQRKQLYLRLLSQILAVIVVLIGLLTLIQYSFNINLGIDQLVFKESENAIATSSPGRMAPNTALCFFCLGSGLILLRYRLISIAQTLACGSFLIALVGFVGYVFRISSFYHLAPFTGMAVHTSMTFLFIGLGVALACPENGWMQEVMSPYLGGITARNLLPLVIGIPILSSGLFLSAYRTDTIPVEVGFVIRSIVNIFILGGVVWWNAKYLNAIDQKYHNAQQALQQYNENLEAKVQRRTSQLESANQALTESRLQLSNLINTLPGIVFSRSANHDWLIESISDGYLSIIGYSKEELCGRDSDRTFQDLIVSEDVPKIVAAIQTAIDHKTTYQVEYRIRTQCGQEKWLWEKGMETSTSIDGNSQTIQGFITEITSIKEAQAALRESEARFRELAENIDEVFYINSADLSQMLYVSHAYQEIWGQTCESVYQNSYAWSESLHPDDGDRLVAACNRLIQGEPLEEEYRIIRPDGDMRWIFTRAFPIYSQSGEILRHVGVAADITNRKQAELEIRQLNEQLEERVQQRTADLIAANKELEAFSYSVSHDLRAPLRGMDGFSKILLERYQDQLDEQGQHYLTRIRSGTQRMGEIIDALLQLSRVTRSQMQFHQVNLSAIAQEIAQELGEREPQRRVEWLISPDLIVQGDPQLLRIVMENLLNNAWKFTSTEIHSKIELACLVSEQENNNYLTYIVRDNGVGFDQTYVNKLFQAFQRLHAMEEFPGTGIGLATVQRIVRRHGGNVWANGSVGEGATFYFTLQS
jgi:PAS domain S-box-containing protein